MVSSLLSAAGWLLGWVFSPVTFAAIAVIVGLIYYRLTRDHGFWQARGVPGPPPTVPWGNAYGPAFFKSFDGFEDWIYGELKGRKFVGYYEIHRPILYVGDPDLIRAITVKDFDHFVNRRDLTISDELNEMMSVQRDKQWKETRAVMSPTFSASKLRAMHQLCLDTAANLTQYLRQEMAAKGHIDLKDTFGRFTMDNIASCAFGVDCNSFKDPNTEFANHAAVLFKPPEGYAALRFLLRIGAPAWVTKMLPDPTVAVMRFFDGVVRRTVGHRQAHGTSRRDFLQLLLETKDKQGNRVLSDSSIVAQSALFLIAGYDTTANTLAFAAYSLAMNPEIQRAAQREVDDVLARHGGTMSYEALGEMTYLDRVVNETLRLYPILHHIERESNKDYTLPGTHVHIPAGTVVQLAVFPMHRDPAIYPDPLRFDPDRFLPEEKERRHPCAYIPFGSGPRNCIAMRFALFEVKVALAAILKESSFEPTPDTPPQPMPVNEKGFIRAPRDGCGFLKVTPRAKQ